jgi:hypothetical protein
MLPWHSGEQVVGFLNQRVRNTKRAQQLHENKTHPKVNTWSSTSSVLHGDQTIQKEVKRENDLTLNKEQQAARFLMEYVVVAVPGSEKLSR